MGGVDLLPGEYSSATKLRCSFWRYSLGAGVDIFAQLSILIYTTNEYHLT
jgi:hypothetical protein